MGADIELVRVRRVGSSSRRWRRERCGTVLDSADRFAWLCRGSGLPMLERVDPYGSLTLSSAEMEQFLSELDALRSQERARLDEELLNQIRELAVECAGDSDLELRIEGD